MNTPKKGNILIIDDDPDILLTARMLLKRHFENVQTTTSPHRIQALFEKDHYDVVLLDMNFARGRETGSEGIRWLKYIRQQLPQTNVVMITAHGEVELAVKAMKEGASDFVVKPWDNQKLLEAVQNAYDNKNENEHENVSIRETNVKPSKADFSAIIGESLAMKKVFALIDKVARTDVNVLILGENGTGKDLVASALHHHSGRREKEFVKVDLGAIPESLFESELFGHKKGAFTDAKTDRAGRFEVASNGTLFLDEIGNVSLPLQAKLLTTLQSKHIIRVGTNRPIDIDVRLVCATNMPLYEMVRQKEFRQDLLYRINTVEIQLPPLRERSEDIPLLAHHFLKLYSQKYQKQGMDIAPATLQKLQEYPWHGNVRELQHALERAIIMADRSVLQPDDFLLHSHSPSNLNTNTVDDILNLEEIEKLAIKNAILKHDGNLSKAAKELGLGRTTLYRKMTKYGL
ncbi:MAG: sigma-54 dependent transcriptional regulator [Chitinophagales bacterium]